jgi:FMN reductase
MSDDGPLIVGIGGSTGASSVTSLLLRACLDETAALGARTLAFTGPELADLPIFAADEDLPVPGADALVAAVRAADAVIIATPGYHGGMSGLVKNAIDHLELLRDDERPYLDGRAVGVIVAAAGWQACGTTLVSVRSAIHSLRGWPTPFGVTVNSAEQHAGADGGFDQRITGALRILARQLTDFAGWRASALASVR